VRPYRGEGIGKDHNDSVLALLSAFQNADKHPELTVIAHGLTAPAFSFILPDGTVTSGAPPGVPLRPDKLIRNGALVHYDLSNPPQPVEMEIEGTPRIVIGSSVDGPVRPCVEILTSMIAIGEGLVASSPRCPGPFIGRHQWRKPRFHR
jgi:hypothetical protein